MTNANESKWRSCTTTFARRDNPFENEVVEVVEYGALDELKAELENYAKLANRAIEDEAAGVTENDKLKEKLRLVIETIKPMHIDDIGYDLDKLDIETAITWHKSNNEKIEMLLSKIENGEPK
jgi:translation elongation factor EF-1beta